MPEREPAGYDFLSRKPLASTESLEKSVKEMEAQIAGIAQKSRILSQKPSARPPAPPSARPPAPGGLEGPVERMERSEERRVRDAASEIAEIRRALLELEKRDGVVVDQVYGGLREIDRIRRSVYPYAEEKNEELLATHMKNMDRNISNISAFLAGQQEVVKRMDARLSEIEKKVAAVESVVGRIDFPIDQLRNLFSILMDTNTQMKGFEVEILTVLRRLHKLEADIRAMKAAATGGSGGAGQA